VTWLWLKVRTSIRLGFQDTLQLQGKGLITGLLVGVIAFIIAYLVTHRPGTLWTLAALPIFVVGTFGFYVIRRLRGWNRLWKRGSRIAYPSDRSPQLNLTLGTAVPYALLIGVTIDITCRVRHPSGAEFEADANYVRMFRGLISTTYPDLFPRAPELTPGTYTVTWLERKPPDSESARWHVIDASRVRVPAQVPTSITPIANNDQAGSSATA
jgi:hypothetical protein